MIFSASSLICKHYEKRTVIVIITTSGVPTGGMGVQTPTFQKDGPRDFPKKAIKLVRQIQYILTSKKGVAPFSESPEGVVSKVFPMAPPPDPPTFSMLRTPLITT